MNFREFADPLRHNDAQDEQDINWLGIDPHVKPPEPQEKWYRGQWHDTSRIGHPTWWTRSRPDANFYTHGQGKVYAAHVNPKARFGTYKDLVRAVRETNATRDQTTRHGGFGGDNDFIYHPEVRRKLEERGIQALLLWDTMMNYEIEAMIVLDPSILAPTDPD